MADRDKPKHPENATPTDLPADGDRQQITAEERRRLQLRLKHRRLDLDESALAKISGPSRQPDSQTASNPSAWATDENAQLERTVNSALKPGALGDKQGSRVLALDFVTAGADGRRRRIPAGTALTCGDDALGQSVLCHLPPAWGGGYELVPSNYFLPSQPPMQRLYAGPVKLSQPLDIEITATHPPIYRASATIRFDEMPVQGVTIEELTDVREVHPTTPGAGVASFVVGGDALKIALSGMVDFFAWNVTGFKVVLQSGKWFELRASAKEYRRDLNAMRRKSLEGNIENRMSDLARLDVEQANLPAQIAHPAHEPEFGKQQQELTDLDRKTRVKRQLLQDQFTSHPRQQMLELSLLAKENPITGLALQWLEVDRHMVTSINNLETLEDAVRKSPDLAADLAVDLAALKAAIAQASAQLKQLERVIHGELDQQMGLLEQVLLRFEQRSESQKQAQPSPTTYAQLLRSRAELQRSVDWLKQQVSSERAAGSRRLAEIPAERVKFESEIRRYNQEMRALQPMYETGELPGYVNF